MDPKSVHGVCFFQCARMRNENQREWMNEKKLPIIMGFNQVCLFVCVFIIYMNNGKNRIFSMILKKTTRSNRRISLVLVCRHIIWRRRHSNESKTNSFSSNIMGLFIWSRKAGHISNYYLIIFFDSVSRIFLFFPTGKEKNNDNDVFHQQKNSIFFSFGSCFVLFHFVYSHSFIHLNTIFFHSVLCEVSSFKFYGGSSSNKFSFLFSFIAK